MSVSKSFKLVLLIGAIFALVATWIFVGHEKSVLAGDAEQTEANNGIVHNQKEDACCPPKEDEVVQQALSPEPVTAEELNAKHQVQAAHDDYFKALFSRGDVKVPLDLFESFKGSQVGDVRSFRIGSVEFNGRIVGVREHPTSSQYGLELDDEVGRVVVNVNGHNQISGFIGFNGDTRVIAFKEDDALQAEPSLVVEEQSVSDLFCAQPETVFPLSNPLNRRLNRSTKSPGAKDLDPLQETADPVAVESNPGSNFVIYCDFDGEAVINDPSWGTIFALPHPKANVDSFVSVVWERVSEDFAAFDINVTTLRSVYDAADPDKRLHVIITPTDDAFPGSGGVAFLGSFRGNSPIVWAFNLGEYDAASTISHEAGHAFGLNHDGRTNADEYYGGHNTDYAPGWAPIMGAPWSDEGFFFIDEVDSWSQGEYTNANNQENDLLIIGSNSNGFGFKDDDFADTLAGGGLEPGVLTITNSNQVSGRGLISSSIDVDLFRFATASGEIDITVFPLVVDSREGESDSNKQGANLAVLAKLYDEVGTLVATGVEAGDVNLASNITADVPFGTYYLSVEGAGRGADGTVGFTDYASLGQYTIGGTGSAQPLQISGGDKVLNPVLEGDTAIFESNGTNFGFTQPNLPVTRTFYLRNTSPSFDITNLSISLAVDSEFEVIGAGSLPTTITAQATLPVSIRYTPPSTGLDFDTVTVTYDGEQSEVYSFAIGGTCSPTANEDNYETNNAFNTAENLTNYEGVLLSEYKGLGWMTDIRDIYKIRVQPGDQLITVDTFHSPNDGAMIFELFRGPSGVLVATMFGEAGSETLQHLIPSNAPTLDYYIRVTPADGTSLKNTYDLRWKAEAISAGSGDLYEENDESGNAFDLTAATSSQLSEILGPATQGDDDWYKLNVPRDPFARFMYVCVEYVQIEGDINVELYDENFNLLEVSSAGQGKEFISYFSRIATESVADDWFPEGNTAIMGVPEGVYYVRVFGDDAGNEYDMFFGTMQDDTYELLDSGDENDDFRDFYDLGTDIIGTSLSNVNGFGVIADYDENASIEYFENQNDDDYFRFEINQQNLTRVEVAFTAQGVSTDYLLYRLRKMNNIVVDSFITDADSPSNATYVLTINNPTESEYLIHVQAAQDIGYITAYDFTVTLFAGTTILPGAVEDNYEENDQFNETFSLVDNEGLWLTSIDGYGALFDADWYEIDIPEGATNVRVRGLFDASLGNVDFELTNENSVVRQAAEGAGNEKTIDWDTPASGKHLIAVTGDRNGNQYNLFWDITRAEDNYEINDTRATAFDLTGHERKLLRKLDGLGIQKNEDWYEIAATADTVELRASAFFSHANGDIDIELYNESGFILGRSVSTTDNESIILVDPAVGRYFVRIYYGNEGNEYDFTWAALNEAEVARLRIGEDAYEENDSFNSPYVLTAAQPRLSNLLGLGTQSDDDWFEITIPENNQGLYVECLFDTTDGDIDFEIYDDFGAAIIRRDSVTDNEFFTLNGSLPAGTYKIRVYGPGLGTPYDLYWVAFVEDIYEQNDIRAEAFDLDSLSGSPLSVTGIPTQGDDDWYELNVAGPFPFIEVTLDYIDLNGAIDFDLRNAAGGLIVDATSTSDTETVFVPVAPGVNYIYVYGDDAFNTYDLSWNVFQDDLYEQNDTSGTAADITLENDITAAQFDDDWYRISVATNNSFLAALASFVDTDGNIDIAVYESSDLINPIAVSNLVDSDVESVTVPVVVGDYYIRVTGDNSNENYAFSWQVDMDDSFEENDTFATAANIITDKAMPLNGIQFDEDWYEVVVFPGEVSLRVDLEFLHAEGDLNASIYAADGTTLLATVDSATDNELLLYGPDPFGNPAGDTYYIKVDGQNFGTSYILTWDASNVDIYEGDTGNNTYGTASDDLLNQEGVRISQSTGYATSQDEDWYRVSIASGDDGIVVEACFVQALGNNIDIELYNALNQSVARSIGFGDSERLHYKGESGDYYLRVFRDTGGNAYDLIWNSYKEDVLESAGEFEKQERSDQQNDSPGDPRRLLQTKMNDTYYPDVEFGERPNLELFLLVDQTQLDEDWYAVEVLLGDDIFIVDLGFDHAGGDIDLAVYDRATGTLIEQAESEDDNERIVVRDLPEGDYLICVYGYGIKNPKENPAWTFDPFTQGYVSLVDNVTPGENSYYDLAEDNAYGLANTYSLRWNSTAEDDFDADILNVDELNDDIYNRAIPPLVDQFGITDSDGIVDGQVRTTTQVGALGPVDVDYRPEYNYYSLVQFDEDWFEFQVDEGGGLPHQLYARIDFEHVQGDLAIEVYDAALFDPVKLANETIDEADLAAALIGSSDTTTDVEFVEFFSTVGRTYYIRVTGEDVGTPYVLTIRSFDDDIYEENDNFVQAFDIQDFAGVIGIQGVQRDLDVYLFTIPKDQVHLIAYGANVKGGEDVVYDVVDASLSPLPENYYRTLVVAPGEALYYLRVDGDDIGTSYSLYWNFDNLDEYEDEDAFGDASDLTRDRLEPTFDSNRTYRDPIQELAFDYNLYIRPEDPFGHAIQEDDDWYAVRIPAWALQQAKKGLDTITVMKRDYFVRLSVGIEFIHADGDINLEVYSSDDAVMPIGRSETLDDTESLVVGVDPRNDDAGIVYYIRVYGDDAENSYELEWSVSTEDAYEGDDTNNFVEKAFDLTNADGVSTEGILLHEIEYLVDVNGDGAIDAGDGGYTRPLGYGSQTTDDWYTIVASTGSTQISVEARFYSDDNPNYDYDPDDLDIDLELYFLAGNDNNPLTADLRKPVLVGRSIEDTAAFNNDEENRPQDVTFDRTEERVESDTFDISAYGEGIYFIRVYYDNRTHPYTLLWDDIGDVDNSGDPAIIDDYTNGDWSFVLPQNLPSALLLNPNLNVDGDRFPNWAEYALGLDPAVPDYTIIGQSIVEIDGENYFQFEYLRTKEAVVRGYEFIVEEADDLVFDGSEAVYLRTESVDADVERVIYRGSSSIIDQERCFFRLVVNEPPVK